MDTDQCAAPSRPMTMESVSYLTRPRIGRWQVADRAPAWTVDRFDRALCVVVDALNTTPATLLAFLDVLMAQYDTFGRTPHISVATTREIAAATFHSCEGPDVDKWTENHGLGFLVSPHPFPRRQGDDAHPNNDIISAHFGGDALGRAVHWARPDRTKDRHDVYGIQITNGTTLRPDWLIASPCAEFGRFPHAGIQEPGE